MSVTINYDALAAALIRVGAASAADGGPVELNCLTDLVCADAVTAESVVDMNTAESHGSASSVKGGVSVAGVDVEGGGARRGADVSVEAGKKGARRGTDVSVEGGEKSESSVGSGDVEDEVRSTHSSLSGGAPGPVTLSVRSVQFGGFPGLQDARPSVRSQDKGWFATYVNTPSLKSLMRVIQTATGVKVPREAKKELALTLYTAGTMPDAIVNGKKDLRALAAIGDAAITMHLVTKVYVAGKTVESAQALRSKMTSNAALRNCMMRKRLSPFVMYAPGVDPATSTTTATALEAMIGVLALHQPTDVVRTFLEWLGLFDNGGI